MTGEHLTQSIYLLLLRRPTELSPTHVVNCGIKNYVLYKNFPRLEHSTLLANFKCSYNKVKSDRTIYALHFVGNCFFQCKVFLIFQS